MRLIACSLLILLAGCASDDGVPPANDAPIILSPGTCDIQLPGGMPADCQQHAAELSGAANLTGAMCTEQTLPGPQGIVQLYRRPLSILTALRIDLVQASSGVAWLESDASRIWFWHNAAGEQRWNLGEIAAGDRIFIKAYTLETSDLNSTGKDLRIEQRWTTVGTQPYAIHRIVAGGTEYFVDRMVGLERNGRVEYSLASFSQDLAEVRLQVTHTPIISTILTIDDVPSC